jgi:SAM-dependent methyltransferase
MPKSSNTLAEFFLNQVVAKALKIPQAGPEISDRIVSFDTQTLARQPVSRQDVVREFISLGDHRAARIVQDLPVSGGDVLDDDAVDDLLVGVHCEMQRMSEEFQHGRRVAELLNPLLQTLRQAGMLGRIRIVDIGCGTGFVVRWLSAHKALTDDIELVGVDHNPALVNEARRLSVSEDLSCQFEVANAFRLAEPAAIYLSTGILHHFRGQALIDLFKQHSRPETRAFVHFDFHASKLAPFGSWLFHAVRMREPLAKYDGVLSAVRAYPSGELLWAVRAGAPEFKSSIYGTRLWGLPIPRVFHALVGVLPQFREDFIKNMGKRIESLGVIE